MYQKYAKLNYTRLRRRQGLFVSRLTDVIEIIPVPIKISRLQKRGLKVQLLLFLLLILKQAKNNPIFGSVIMVTHHVGPIAQLDRASVFETEGWAFESLWDHH